MKKEYWFVITLLIGVAVIVIIGTFYYISEVENIPAYAALYISIVTAGYAALSKLDPNKIKRQELYGQLKSDVTTIISELDDWKYQVVKFNFWMSIGQDERYHLLDEKLTKQLDSFSNRVKKYSSAIEKLNFYKLPELIRDVADEVFNKSPNTANMVHISLFIGIKNRSPSSMSIEILEHLKKKHGLSEVAEHIREKMHYEKEEITCLKWQLQYSGINETQKEIMEKFWNNCLRKIDSFPEYKFIVKENPILLKEAKEIKQELIKRLEKTIKS